MPTIAEQVETTRQRIIDEGISEAQAINLGNILTAVLAAYDANPSADTTQLQTILDNVNAEIG